MKAAQFVSKIDEETFNSFKDRLMKAVSHDLKLIAFILWSLNLLYRDLSFKEIVSFIGQVSEEELSKTIVRVDQTEVSTIDNPGVKYDALFDIFEKGKYIGSFGFEDQIKKLGLIRRMNRSGFYLCAMIFREGRKGGPLDKETYKNLEPCYILWVYPFNSTQTANSFSTHSFDLVPKDLEDEMFGHRKLRVKNEQIDRPIILKSFSAYLGNPSDLVDSEEIKNEQVKKHWYLIRLLDAIFNFELSPESRLKILDDYNLNENEEVSVMSEFKEFIQAVQEPLQEEINQYKNDVSQYKREVQDRDQVIKAKDKMIFELKKELEQLKNSNNGESIPV